jgi:hypothetical protein
MLFGCASPIAMDDDRPQLSSFLSRRHSNRATPSSDDSIKAPQIGWGRLGSSSLTRRYFPSDPCLLLCHATPISEVPVKPRKSGGYLSNRSTKDRMSLETIRNIFSTLLASGLLCDELTADEPGDLWDQGITPRYRVVDVLGDLGDDEAREIKAIWSVRLIRVSWSI